MSQIPQEVHDDIIKLYHNGAIEEGMKKCHAALDKFPEISNFSFLMALLHFKKQEAEAGLKQLDKFITYKECPPEYLKNSAFLFQQYGYHDASFETFSRYLEIVPDDHSARYAYGAFLSRAGKLKEALSCYMEAIRRQPADPEAYCEAGYILDKIGLPEEALRLYKKALEINPAHRSRIRMGKVLLDLAKIEEFKENQVILKKYGLEIASLSGMIDKSGLIDPMNLDQGCEFKVSWHKTKNVRYFPIREMQESSYVTLLEKTILKDETLPGPIFNDHSKLLTFGSCFAAHLRGHLMSHGKLSEQLTIPPGLNNTFALENFITWCLTGNTSKTAYWYDENPKLKGAMKWVPKEEQTYYKEIMQQTDGFIFTLGLSEVWRDKETQGVFWRGVPASIFDPEKHELVLSSVDENRKNLGEICDRIRDFCGDKPIIFTLSPIPLQATFRNMSCICADAVSKSVLRVAIDMLMSEKRKNVYYWPSFEMIRWIGSHIPDSLYCRGAGTVDDSRHVPQEVVGGIISLFIKNYFAENSPPAPQAS